MKAFGTRAPDFWFVVEAAYLDNRLHLHGGILPVEAAKAAEGVELALMEAGGDWASVGHSDKQVCLRSLYGPYNWASYVVKRMNPTQGLIKGRTVAATRGMASRTQARWPTLRTELSSA